MQEKGDHLHFYTSGFRFGVRKTGQSKKGERRYSNYNGIEYFNKRGKHLAISRSDGTLLLQKPRWADNYCICVGIKDSIDLLAQCYDKIYGMGVAGVDLDQNLGGGFADCFNPEHQHPMGAGLWKTQAMEKFLNTIIDIQKRRGGYKFFQGVEEPCERFAHLIDIYHGRAFTDTHWPATGPGAVSIPLYLFLYHEYQLGYAGWIDKGFSPSGDIKYGIGRSFIFGMQPGIRLYGSTMLTDPVTEELLMLKSSILLMKQLPQYVLHGRMVGEATIIDALPFDNSRDVPVHWSSVQGIEWQLPENKTKVILLTNLSRLKQTVQVGVADLACNILIKMSSVDGMPIKKQRIRQTAGKVSIELAPWELAAIVESE